MQPHDRLGPVVARHGREIDPDELGRAAADIDHQKLLGAPRDERRAGDHRQPRLFLGRDDLEREAGLAPDLADEVARIPGPAAGLGRHQPHPAHLMLLDLLLADPERLDRAPHRGARQPAGGFQPDAELHGLGKGIHDLKLTAPRLGNQHAAAVGAEVQRRIKLPPVAWRGDGRFHCCADDQLVARRDRVRTPGTLGRHRRPPFMVAPRVCARACRRKVGSSQGAPRAASRQGPGRPPTPLKRLRLWRTGDGRPRPEGRRRSARAPCRKPTPSAALRRV